MTGTAIGEAAAGLRTAREAWRARQPEGRDVASFPSRAVVEDVVALLAAALYPRRLGQFRGKPVDEDNFVVAKLLAAFTALEREIGNELGYWQAEARGAFEKDLPATIVRLFGATLGDIRRLIDSDVEAAFLGDPAARSVDEILVSYPGAIASLHHRISHQLDALGAPIVARLISEIGNERTGIDIHPGAAIGEEFFIDHGTGVVIGETAIIGARVRLYQHVTLGARSALGAARRKGEGGSRYARHPIVGDDVVVYAGATILGRVTIGARSTIGGNVWLLSDVPPDSVVVQPEAQLLDRSSAGQLRDELA
ncbi:serine acetyltransferase [Microvirga sp. SRT01]|uniref:serine O-acetyltransferase n=1 Tax=Sphingomonas longa TaxID=2778730 RepID=A0ABS2D2F5_9SPHN|nr:MULTISPECIES: serine O-acetyltransferase EpsC [Alphaproteobacteria]MBM6575112.1 serine acetyltransferase [Sphingomonas sp. BT552]MBR7708163.1 serine acetyltransferase [Microvirga sp. SRT01]